MIKKGFNYNIKIWKIIWNKILFSSSPEVANYMSLVMDTCEFHPLKINDIPKSFDIPLWLKEIKDEDNNSIDGDKYDFLYQVFRFLGYLKGFNLPQEISNAINEFINENFENLNLPNDVKLGYEEGIRIWEKHH